MTIVLPIFFFAVILGLFVRPMSPRVWCAMGAWIALVIAFQYFSH